MPLIKANPSLDPSLSALRLNLFSISLDSYTSPLYSTSPNPIKGSDKWDSGERSPDAPNEPYL